MRNLSGLYLFLQDVELFFPWPQISRSAVSSFWCGSRCSIMSNRTSQFTEPIGRQVGARVQQLSCILDLEAVKLEIICSKKNSRSVYASAVTAKSSKIIGLISDDRNLQEVKEKLINVDNAFQRLQEAHYDYSSESMDEDGIPKYQLYLGSEERKFGLFLQQIVDWITVTEEKLLADSLQLDSVVKPEDSISFAGASEPWKAFNASKLSKLSSGASSRGSRASSVALARAKVAKLRAEIAMLEKRQALEERVSFETGRVLPCVGSWNGENQRRRESPCCGESAKERALAAMNTPFLPELWPVKLELRFNEDYPRRSSMFKTGWSL